MTARPPLGVWLAALLLALAALAALALAGPWLQRSAIKQRLAHDDYNFARMQVDPEGRPRVVALGASKLFYAVEYDGALARNYTPDLLPLDFIRLTWLDARPADLAPAFDALQAAPPKLLLLEADLLQFDRDSRLPIRDNLRALFDRLFPAAAAFDESGRLIDDNHAGNRGQDGFKDGHYCADARSPEGERAWVAAASRWRVLSAERQAAYQAALQALRAAGTEVVLLRLPRSPSADAAFPEPLGANAEASLDAFASRLQLPQWAPPPLADDLYCDQGHVNRAGRAVYSAWLASQLQQWLMAR